MLQAATWSFGNASIKMRNKLVEMRNGLKKSLVLFPAVDLIDAISEQVNTCKHELYPSFIFILFYVFYLILVYFSLICSDGKSFWFFVYGNIDCVHAGITTSMSISDGFDPYFFLSKDGKDAVYGKIKGRRGVYFRPESVFFL